MYARTLSTLPLSSIHTRRNVMNLTGRAAIVTGAGRGLGKAISLAFELSGANVALFSLVKDELEEVSADLDKLGGEYLLHAGDTTDEQEVASVVAETISRFGRIDILVNNAGIIGPARFLEDTLPTDWKQTLDVNLTGCYLFCRKVLPHMVDHGSGKIINIVSGLGQMPFPRFCAYSVSKAGIIQLTRSLSEELKPFNVQVNAVDPGLMDTTIGNDIRAMGPDVLGEGLYNQMIEYKEQGLLKDPRDVADLVAYLASIDSGDMTGHIGTLKYYRGLGWSQSEPLV
jgi:NAD(P)-dependent dehydrogenase (short-subunit alcohol dehydrogenase family)